jgi:hypothetical protein
MLKMKGIFVEADLVGSLIGTLRERKPIVERSATASKV